MEEQEGDVAGTKADRCNGKFGDLPGLYRGWRVWNWCQHRHYKPLTALTHPGSSRSGCGKVMVLAPRNWASSLMAWATAGPVAARSTSGSAKRPLISSV